MIDLPATLVLTAIYGFAVFGYEWSDPREPLVLIAIILAAIYTGRQWLNHWRLQRRINKLGAGFGPYPGE